MGEKVDDLMIMYVNDILIILVNLVGVLVILVLCGFGVNNMLFGL